MNQKTKKVKKSKPVFNEATSRDQITASMISISRSLEKIEQRQAKYDSLVEGMGTFLIEMSDVDPKAKKFFRDMLKKNFKS